MAIKITDNFQVNIKNPIDNRFVVGSQSIPGGPGSIYPTPFYAYRDDISSNMGFVYPGLRIWDFNDNLPYFWTGTTWSNENLTGASVLNSGDPGFSLGGGYRNYITKFYDTSTVLTKSLLFDDNVHVSLDITGVVNPNSSGGAGNPNLNTTVGSVPSGLHVRGRIRTNTGFVGYGGYIHSINAQNIDAGPSNTGRLQLPLIATPGVTNPTITYVLTSQINPVTLNIVNSWQNILNVAPLYSPTNLGSGVQLFSGTVGLNHEFFSLVSNGLQIDPGSAGSVRIESKAAVNVGGGSASVYKGLDGNKIHEFKTINSNFMNITQTSDVINLNSNITSSSLQVNPNPNDPHGITIEIPASFEGTDYYVNNGYTGAEQLGTRSKPFRDLKACINKILNRTSNSGPTSYTGGFIGGVFTNGANPERPSQMNVTPDTFDPEINGGQPYRKWEIRTGKNQPKPTYSNNYYSNLPGSGAVRVIIQSYSEIDENLAINGVTYLLEKPEVSNIVVLSDFYNDPGTPEDGTPFTYLFDMVPLAGTANLNDPLGREATGIPKGNPVIWTGTQLISVSKPFQMDYGLNCRLVGSGQIGFSGLHKNRKGFFRSKGINSYDFSLAANLINPSIPIYNSDSNRIDEHDCNLFIGIEAGYITCNMDRLPVGFEAAHTGSPIQLYWEDGGNRGQSNTVANGNNTITLTTANPSIKLGHSVTVTTGTKVLAPNTTVTSISGLTIGLSQPTIASSSSPVTYEFGTKITREGMDMEGYITTAVPDYGAIQVEGRNLMFSESLFFAGTVVINCSEQHMIYGKDYGTMYAESGRIYMRRHYQKVLYSTVEFTPINTVQDPYYLNGDAWYKIISVTGSGTHYTNWTDSNFFRQDTWKNQVGDSIAAPTFALDATAAYPSGWIGLTVQTTNLYKRVVGAQTWNGPSGDSTAPFTSGGSSYGTPNSISHKGRVRSVKKFYRPCNHVYDIYLKNGAQWNHGGDFYTQQNTGALQGGACAFLGIENNIKTTGDPTHPINTNGLFPTTGCSFRANGGGFVSNLFYNYFIKYILDDSYLANRYEYKHNITFKSLKIDSSVFNSVIGVFKTSGANAANNYLTNHNTILGLGIQNWTQFIYIGSFTNCYFFDSFAYLSSTLRTPFSNISINNGIRVDISNTIYNANNGSTGQLYKGLRVDGNNGVASPSTIWYYYGLMSLSGTSIELSSGSINTSIPLFTSNADALSYGYPVGGIYLDRDETEPILKVVKNVS